MDDKKVARINELYHKSKSEGLTPEELKEQQILRKEYIDSFKRNLRGQLNNISIKEKDGSITNLGEKFGNKKEIRHKIIRLRKEMDPLVWQQATNDITERVINHPRFLEETDIYCYANYNGEVGTLPSWRRPGSSEKVCGFRELREAK